MVDEPDAVHATRLPLAVWNAACRAVGGDAPGLNDDDWQHLAQAGIASAPGTLDERWRGLIASYLDTDVSFRVVATYNGLLYRSSLALGAGNVCVLQRYKTETQPDGSRLAVAHDDLVEVAATTGHPWLLLSRVIPPLGTLTAPAHQTSAASATPVRLDDATRERVKTQLAATPDADVAEVLAAASDTVADVLSADAMVTYVMTAGSGENPVIGAAWYLASAERVYRATFGGDPAWEEVRPGDLAFTFEWHLLGAQTAVGA